MSGKDRMPKGIARVAALAEACTLPGDELIRIHLIKERKKAYPPRSIRRASGRPIGVDENTRPRRQGQFKQYLLTIDLDEVPQVRVWLGWPMPALAVFIGDADGNHARSPATDETAEPATRFDAVSVSVSSAGAHTRITVRPSIL